MDQNIKIKFNKINEMVINNNGYIDLNNTSIKDEKDLLNLCSIFRDARYETFRIFYMKDGKIVGQEAITSRIPNAVKIVPYTDYSGVLKWYEKMRNRMCRLKADSYYLAHNHASESALPSKKDIGLTYNIAKNVNGFLGHIIFGSSNRYSIIERDSYGNIKVPREQLLNDSIKKKVEEKLKHKDSFYDIKIANREELVALLKIIQNEREYSSVILTDSTNKIRVVLDVPNKMFNQTIENLNGFFRNLATKTGTTRVFVGTNNEKTYNKLIEHQKYGTIKDIVYFDKRGKEKFGLEVVEDLFDKEKTRNKGREER